MSHDAQEGTATAELEASGADVMDALRVQDCYQCGKCTAGCPVAQSMDLMPNQILRLVQLGHLDRAMRSQAVWQCVACQTCTARCPKSVDCAGVMDVLRQRAAACDSAAPAQSRTVLFYKAFLRNIRRNGRLGEVELVRQFKTATFVRDLNVPFLFKDSTLALKMLKRGKFHVVGEKVRDRAVVARIFDRCFRAAGDAAKDSESRKIP